MKQDVKIALEIEREKNQRAMVEGVEALRKAFKNVEKAVESYKRDGSKDYSKIEKAVNKYATALQNVK